ncbi:hypothetical protein C7N43_38600 [Sphingobacteriales bacterium UPWRP_1]|nr:hypothetical protein C7N43_38600 [Sphingobacteriales bacterium UPWRP_1]
MKFNCPDTKEIKDLKRKKKIIRYARIVCLVIMIIFTLILSNEADNNNSTGWPIFVIGILGLLFIYFLFEYFILKKRDAINIKFLEMHMAPIDKTKFDSGNILAINDTHRQLGILYSKEESLYIYDFSKLRECLLIEKQDEKKVKKATADVSIGDTVAVGCLGSLFGMKNIGALTGALKSLEAKEEEYTETENKELAIKIVVDDIIRPIHFLDIDLTVLWKEKELKRIADIWKHRIDSIIKKYRP